MVCLFLTTPIAWKGVLKQYVGRLHRKYEGKETVVVHDYVDIFIPVFERMYKKRMSGYKKIGYTFDENMHRNQPLKKVFDIESFENQLKKDISKADKEIFVYSNNLFEDDIEKLLEFIEDIKLRVTFVTTAPTPKSFEKYHNMTFVHNKNTVDKNRNCIIIIDRQVCWYGDIQLLSNTPKGQLTVRVNNTEISEQLVEILSTK